jgi:hypothetical protein
MFQESLLKKKQTTMDQFNRDQNQNQKKGGAKKRAKVIEESESYGEEEE